VVAATYRERLVPVTHFIHARQRSSVQRFADAFRLGKEERRSLPMRHPRAASPAGEPVAGRAIERRAARMRYTRRSIHPAPPA